ncbi:MAG: iron-containing alcohol dehydrogenase [Acidimicrobiales bacterium]
MPSTEFEFATAGRIVFGVGRSKELAPLARRLGSRALVCTGAEPGRHRGLLQDLEVPFTTFEVHREPTVELARQAVATARDGGVDLVIAVGGGSVMDLGKALAMLLGNGGDPLDYLEVVGEGRAIDKPSAPCIALPTTAGTGAEVTPNAVLASPEHGLKASLRSPLMLPTLALVDPLLTVSSPPGVTASSGMDALTQCLEPLVSIRATPMTDALASEGLRRAAAGLRRGYADGNDLVARTDMALCSLLGGLSLANAKLGTVHGLAGVIGGTVDVPHGIACAALLVATFDANVKALRARQPDSQALVRYQEAARLLTGRADATIEQGSAWIAETVRLLGIPKLSRYGLTREHADDVVERALRASSTKGNPIDLNTDELHAVFAAAL